MAKADDRRHCTFRPRISGKAAELVGDQQDFLGRMQAKEAERRRELEQKRQKEDYEARLDKKVGEGGPGRPCLARWALVGSLGHGARLQVCPRCRATQTFQEFKDNKKHCSTCSVEFRPGRAWVRRMRRWGSDRGQGAAGLLGADSRAPGGHLPLLPLPQGDVQRSFIKRLEEGEKEKQRKLKDLERTLATEKYPFAPKKRESKASQELPDAAATV